MLTPSQCSRNFLGPLLSVLGEKVRQRMAGAGFDPFKDRDSCNESCVVTSFVCLCGCGLLSSCYRVLGIIFFPQCFLSVQHIDFMLTPWPTVALWQPRTCWGSEEIRWPLWNPKVDYVLTGADVRPCAESADSCLHPLYLIIKIHFNSILTSASKSSSSSLAFCMRVDPPTPIHVAFPLAFYHPCFEYADNIWRWVQSIEFLVQRSQRPVTLWN